MSIRNLSNPYQAPRRKIHIEGATLQGVFSLTKRTDNYLQYERNDGLELRFVDSGRPESRRLPRWYVADDRGRCIGSIWRDNGQAEFDDMRHRYRVRRVNGIESIELIAIRPKRQGRRVGG